MFMKRRSKKILFSIVILVVCCLCFICVGCQKNSTDDINSAESSKKTLSLLYFGEKVSLKSILQKFQIRHENISVSIEYFSSDQYAEIIQERVSCGIKLADIVFMEPNYGLFLSLVNRGRLTDLSEYSVLRHYPQDNLSLYQVNQKQYGIPFSSNSLIVCYNRKILEQYGLEIPETWEETQTFLDVLIQHNILPITFGGEQNDSFYNAFIPILLSVLETHHQTNSFMKDLQNGKVSADDPVILDYLNLIQDMTEKGYFASENLTFKGKEAVDCFVTEKAGILLTDEQSMSLVDHSVYEIAPLPLSIETAGNVFSIGHVLGVDSKSELHFEVQEFLEFLSDQEIMTEYYSATGQNVLNNSLFENFSDSYKTYLDPMIYIADCDLWVKQPFSDMTARIMTGQNIADIVENTQDLFDDLRIPQYVFLS